MDKGQTTTRRRLIIGTAAVLALLGFAGYALFGRGGDPAVDPNQDELLGLHDGTIFYRSVGLYSAIDENDDIFRAVEQDVILFARTTRPEFKNPDTKVSFTFDKNVKREDDTSVFTGNFYGLDDKIEIRLTAHGRGVFTLSITNLEDGANIDDQLSLNGKRNAYIRTLPIQKGFYSVRYQLPNDRIVVTFYDGYTEKDVNEVVASVSGGLGQAESEDVVYSLNRIGIVSLDQVRQNLVEPLPQP